MKSDIPTNIVLPKDSELQDILVECYRSTKFAAKILFPDSFSSPFCQLHDQIFDLIDSGAKKIAIAAPRGIGKTTILAKGYLGKRILFRDVNFCPYVSQSADAAIRQTENLKRELISSPIIKKIFGNVKAKKDDFGIEESFSKVSWVAKFDEDHGGTMVLPRGSGQQIRGVLFGNHRPDLIIVDDFEDPETIGNDEIRAKRKEWFYADLMKCVSRMDRDWRILYIDTLKHEDALIEDLINSSDWESLRLELCDDDFNTNAPEFISTEEIIVEANELREKGQMDVFYREYRNIPISKEDASFKQEYFKEYDEKDLEGKDIRNVIIVDPAKTAKVQSADSAIICVGVDRAGHAVYFRDCIAGKMYPDEIYDNMFEMVIKHNSNLLAVEVTGLSEFIVQPIKNEMRKRGIYPTFLELKARGKKEDRIASLVSYYRQGHIYHNKTCSTKLENQLLMYPRSKLWDVMDAFAYIVEIMDMDNSYFDPKDFFESEDEEVYEDLENDKIMNYRRSI